VIVTSGNEVARHTVTEYLGIVRGYASFLARAGDELDECHQEAMDSMVSKAQTLDADAVIGFRFEVCPNSGQGRGILAYGTAVKLTR